MAGAMAHYPKKNLLLALYHVPQVGSGYRGSHVQRNPKAS
jgi:hypothetical protein